MNDDLSNFLKQSRLNKNLSQQELANQCRVSKSYINKIEHNQSKKPSIEVLYNISKALDLDYIDLIEKAGYDIDDIFINNDFNNFIMNYEIKHYDNNKIKKYKEDDMINIYKVIEDFKNNIIDDETALYLFISWVKNKNIN